MIIQFQADHTDKERFKPASRSILHTAIATWSSSVREKHEKLRETRSFAQHTAKEPEHEESFSFVFEFSIRLDRSVER